MKLKRVGNMSTKYCFEPQRIDSDIQNKIAVNERFKQDLKAVLYADYKYDRDNGSMSLEAKRQALLEVHREFIEILIS